MGWLKQDTSHPHNGDHIIRKLEKHSEHNVTSYWHSWLWSDVHPAHHSTILLREQHPLRPYSILRQHHHYFQPCILRLLLNPLQQPHTTLLLRRMLMQPQPNPGPLPETRVKSRRADHMQLRWAFLWRSVGELSVPGGARFCVWRRGVSVWWGCWVEWWVSGVCLWQGARMVFGGCDCGLLGVCVSGFCVVGGGALQVQ